MLTKIAFLSLLYHTLVPQRLSLSNPTLSLLFWNLRTFGKNRASPENGKHLYEITSSYDVLLFAEIRDSDCNIHPECPLQTFFETYFPEHQLFLSPSLHYCDASHHSGSEEYAMLVRKSLNQEVSMIHYNDPNCVFIRKPYGLKFPSFQVLVFHSNPNNEKELIELSNVFEQFENRQTFLMGDLNTGCHYVPFSKLEQYDIGRNYSWLLSETQYTNVEKTCPYDRILSTLDISDRFLNGQVLNLHDEAKRIGSDHYPISIRFKNYL